MKKILIITLYSNDNFGNKLQNYALQEYIKKLDSNLIVETQRINYEKLTNNILVHYIWIIYNTLRKKIFNSKKIVNKREKKFIDFNNKYINYTNTYIGTDSFKKIKGYDYYIYGSDQIWNPNGLGKSRLFMGQLSNRNISYAASLSSNFIPDELKKNYKKQINNFLYVSVREEKAKELLEELDIKKDIEVLIDPTMLLTEEEWDKLSIKPIQFDNIKEDKYILNYFLGDLSDDKKSEIERVAEENNCYIINILDENDPFYNCGPSEFLYLEKHAYLICTDSFHSCVFAILYNRPFIIFDRESKNMGNMNSRIDTLIKKFKLNNRKYNCTKITKENLNHNYLEAYKILEEERKKSKKFLKKTLDVK